MQIPTFKRVYLLANAFRQGVDLIQNKQLIEHMINYECISIRLLKVTIEPRSDIITYKVYFVVYGVIFIVRPYTLATKTYM